MFTCFGIWHLCYILLAVVCVADASAKKSKMDAKSRERMLNRWINLAFGLYIAPWVMPFVNVAVFFGVEMLVCGIFAEFKKYIRR